MLTTHSNSFSTSDSLFVDSSAWIAFFNKEDTFHRQAAELFSKKSPFITSDIIFHETIAHISRRLNKKIAQEAGCFMLSPAIKLVVTGKGDLKEMWKLYWDQENKISLVDCSCVIVMKKFRISSIFTFDKHFDTLGIPRVPVVAQ